MSNESQQQEDDDEQRQATLIPSRLQSLGFALAANGDAILPPTVEVPAGPFTMGSDQGRDAQAQPNEHQIALHLAAFRIGVYPVTVAEYACALVTHAKDVPQPTDWDAQQPSLDYPVVSVSWRHAVAYAAWLSEMTGEVWRLPTEAEWERAARGTDGRIYPWGNAWDALRANTIDTGPKTTSPIGHYASAGADDPKGDASPAGLHDMAGNVWEWTGSIYQESYESDQSEIGSDESAMRVLRGGSWGNYAPDARAAYRNKYRPGVVYGTIGFRLARGPLVQ